MKILHTSDWHIGKKLMNRERLDEQREVLDEIATIAEQNGVELILVAGDIYDTFLPQAEAEELFFQTVKKLAGENRAVFIVSGNHDDAVRLAACAPLGEELGVYVVGSQADTIKIDTETSTRPVRPVEAGEGYVVFENAKGERVFINALPYPNEARLKEEKSEDSYNQKMRRWIESGQSGYKGDMPCILLSHIFVAGGSVSDGERDIDLGGARAVDLTTLPKFDYIALGHLHKKQRFTKQNAWYSGSILQYSFDETGTSKRVILLDTDERTVINTEEVTLTKGKKLLRLKASSVAEGVGLLEDNPDCHIELTLSLTSPLTSEETRSLHAHKCLKSLIPAVRREGTTGFSVKRRDMNTQELFEEYYRLNYGVEAEDNVKSLFLELLQEVQS